MACNTFNIKIKLRLKKGVIFRLRLFVSTHFRLFERIWNFQLFLLQFYSLRFSSISSFYFFFFAQIFPIYRRRFRYLLVDSTFELYTCQHQLSFILLVVWIEFWNSYRNNLEQLTHFITVKCCSPKIRFPKIL